MTVNGVPLLKGQVEGAFSHPQPGELPLPISEEQANGIDRLEHTEDEAVSAISRKGIDPFLPLPNELIAQIFGNLAISDLMSVAQVSQHGRLHANVQLLAKAKRLGLDKDQQDLASATHYISSLLETVRLLAEKSFLPGSKLVYRENTYKRFFLIRRVRRVLDAEKTLENLEHLWLHELMFIYRNPEIYNLKNIELFSGFLSKSSVRQGYATDDDKLSTLLIDAAQAGDACIVQMLLEQGAPVNAPRWVGNTALLASLMGHKPEVLELLLENGADPNSARQDGFRPLTLACKEGMTDSVSLLLKYNADPNLAAELGSPPLHYAAQQGNIQIVEFLLVQGAAINAPGAMGNTALLCALQSKQAGVARVLLENGADPNMANQAGDTPLTLAIQNGDWKLVRSLLRQGVPINRPGRNGDTALLTAVRTKWVPKLLLDNGADPDIANQDGITPLALASMSGMSRTVARLLEFNANPTIPSRDGDAPLHYAARQGQTQIVKLLLGQGAPINAPGSMGNTALFAALKSKKVGVLRALLENGADPDIANQAGEIPLVWASKKGFSEAANLLLDYNANPNVRVDARTPILHFAIKNGDIALVKSLMRKGVQVSGPGWYGDTALLTALRTPENGCFLALIENGADPNLANRRGVTPLGLACEPGLTEVGQPYVVTRLLRANANPNLPSRNGDSPLHWAARHGSIMMVESLLRHGAKVNAQGFRGKTPLDVAIKFRKDEVADLLRSKGGRRKFSFI